MVEIGRVCVKLVGREAGKKAIIVDVLEGNFVMIDGNVKRRKCNITHLETLPEKFEIKKGATTEEVKHIFKQHGLLEEHKQSIANKRPRKGGEQQKKTEKKEEKAPKAKKAKKSEEEIVEESLVEA